MNEPSQADRREFQQLREECERFESEIRKASTDPVFEERRFAAMWHRINLAEGLDARLTIAKEHLNDLANQVRKLSEARWQIITRVNA